MKRRVTLLISVLGLAALLAAGKAPGPRPEQRVAIRVRANAPAGTLEPVWAYFGYDEPNFTYTKLGTKLLSELVASSPAPVHIRTHNLLTTGDGTPALKWGSTNAYSEDAAGRPVYDWTILDRIFDAYRDAGAVPFVEIGFMPEALSVHPEPYQHHWPKGPLWTGWAYPPKDYGKWAGLVRQWVEHCAARYGREQVATWRWEVWNEPDIGYWQGTPDEYFKLYDYTAEAVKSALPEAQVGGPATTGPANPRAAAFLRNFLEHCRHGVNAATGKTGAPLDFISFHAKGTTRFMGGHVEMDVGKQLRDVAAGFEIVSHSPGFEKLPIILSESDPEGCAACDALTHPENGYRNTAQYASYEAEALGGTLELAARYRINLAGVLTWAFEFENQPIFAGFRTLATHGIDKPVLNAFRLFGLLGEERIDATSSAALPLDEAIRSGLHESSDVNVLAARDARSVSVLVWNYRDDDVPAFPAQVELQVEGLSRAPGRVLVEHYRIDGETSNSYSAWRKMSSPPEPSPEQLGQLRAAGQLQLLGSPQWVPVNGASLKLDFPLPPQAVSLVRLSW